MTTDTVARQASAKIGRMSRPAALFWGGLAVLVMSVSLAVSMGAIAIPLDVVWSVVANKLFPGSVEVTWSLGRENIIWEIRLPRAFLAALVGAGLGMVGAALQSITRNHLADPHLLGVSSGAAFGAILALLHTGLFLGLLTVPLLAFGGALMATMVVVGVSHFANAMSADRLVLTGVAVSFVIMAMANFLIFLGDPRATNMVVFWLLGGLGLAQWSHLIYPLGALCVCGVYFQMHANDLNAMTIGDESAATLGVPVTRFRIEIFVVSALLTGTMVAFSGTIGFVGLMVPHIVRYMVGGDNRRVIPFSALFGAIFLVWADIVARTIMAPEDMPIGILTGLFGGVFFIALLRRRGRGL